MMINEALAERSFDMRMTCSKDTPALGQALRNVFRYVFDQRERWQKANDFVWSYEELADDMPG